MALGLERPAEPQDFDLFLKGAPGIDLLAGHHFGGLVGFRFKLVRREVERQLVERRGPEVRSGGKCECAAADV